MKLFQILSSQLYIMLTLQSALYSRDFLAYGKQIIPSNINFFQFQFFCFNDGQKYILNLGNTSALHMGFGT